MRISLAKRVRAEFEEAVRLNPRNAEALADLGEFYYTAPGVVGGGIDKAEGVAAQLDKIDPCARHELRGHIAEQRKDYGTAEREFKQAIAARRIRPSVDDAGRLLSPPRALDGDGVGVRSGENAAERDKHAGVALYQRASLLIAPPTATRRGRPKCSKSILPAA
jgi:tetratricopeptide (TPR) repeat protein